MADLLGNRAITEFYGRPNTALKRPQLLIMDEVDGMSAGDRGGVQGKHGLLFLTQIYSCVS